MLLNDLIMVVILYLTAVAAVVLMVDKTHKKPIDPWFPWERFKCLLLGHIPGQWLDGQGYFLACLKCGERF